MGNGPGSARWLAILMLSACTTVPDETPEPMPAMYFDGCLSLVTETVELGEQPLGDPLVAETRIQNDCGGQVSLGSPILDPDVDYVQLDEYHLAAGARTSLQAHVTPSQLGGFRAFLTLPAFASDPLAPRDVPVPDLDLVVRVVGETRGAVLSVENAATSAPRWCPAEGTARLVNRGNEPATITDIVADPGATVAADVLATLPWTLAPGEARDLLFAADSTVAGQQSTPVTVSYTDNRPRTAAGRLRSIIQDRPLLTETVQVPDAVAHDLLVTLDRDALQRSPESLTDLMRIADRVAREPRDLRLTVITEADGCPLGDDTWIDSSFASSGARAALATQADLDFELGLYGSHTERGFDLGRAALERMDDGACLERFHRQWADLSVVHVSAGEEHGETDVAAWVDAVQRRAHIAYSGTVHAVTPEGCDGADATPRYQRAADTSRGQYLSLCQAWADSLLDGLTWSPPRPLDRIALPERPWPPSLSVSIDDQAIQTWTWEAAEQAVRLDPPALPGSTVSVTYATGSCPD